MMPCILVASHIMMLLYKPNTHITIDSQRFLCETLSSLSDLYLNT